MSKVVKGVGRAIGKVVKGVGNVVKKVASSKFGKILLTAAAVYFGGAAIMGAMGGASAGTGFMGTISGALQGAAAGIGNAWTGLTGAASSALGGNFGSAASSLGQGFSGAYSAGSGAVQGVTAAINPTNIVAGNPVANATNPALIESSVGTPGYGPSSATPGFQSAPSASKGLVGSFMNSPYTAPALISGGTQLIGGAMQGYGAQQQQKEQLKLAAAERNRYNANVGARLWPNAG